MILVVDRIEEGIAELYALDHDIRLSLPVTVLPENTREGDHLRVSFEKDADSRAALKRRVETLLSEMKKEGE